jgi:hypothetical protein
MTARVQSAAPEGFRLTGQAVVTVLAGAYRLTYGEAGYSTTTGTGDRDTAERSAARHGFRVGPWHTVTLPTCGGETVHTAPLFARDWTGCPS